MPPSAKNTEYGICTRYWRLVYCLGLPLDVEGADRGGVVLVAGHDVHRAAGHRRRSSSSQARPSATSTHALAVAVQGVPATSAPFAAGVVGPRARRGAWRWTTAPFVVDPPDPPAGAGAAAGAAAGRGPAAGARAPPRRRGRQARQPGRAGPRAGRRRARCPRRAADSPGCPAATEHRRADDDERRGHRRAEHGGARTADLPAARAGSSVRSHFQVPFPGTDRSNDPRSANVTARDPSVTFRRRTGCGRCRDGRPTVRPWPRRASCAWARRQAAGCSRPPCWAPGS